jgi:signal transduction histidine kinase/ActR/RegA family two-component response regulator
LATSSIRPTTWQPAEPTGDARGDAASEAALSLAVLRNSQNGIALLARGGWVNRNGPWIELCRDERRWATAADGEAGTRTTYASLEIAAEALGRELLAASAPRARRTLRVVRERDEAVVELRLERIEANRPPIVAAVAEDVTDRVRAERDAARAREATVAVERMRLLGELASGVAHDLNNTLHALSLRIGHLAASPLDEDQRENVAVLGRICADAAERVSRLQELAWRREDVPTESFDVATVIEEAIAAARPELDDRAHANGVRFTLETDLERGVHAVGSAGELRHVFVNLLLNARDAMPRGGRIRVSSHTAAAHAEVRVEDEGTGIAPEHLDRLFDPFFTTKGPPGGAGIGLGLAIVQGVMRRLGGQVVAGNRPEGGAVFSLTFPIAGDRPERAGAAPAPEVASGHRLLVVDDDVDNLEATKYVLEDLGQEPDLAACGEDALALVRDGNRYDLVLCDVGMPGLNGWQVAEEMKRLVPAMPIVLVTGWAQEIAPDDPKRAGVDGILGKPLGVGDLQHALEQWLGAAGAPRR